MKIWNGNAEGCQVRGTCWPVDFPVVRVSSKFCLLQRTARHSTRGLCGSTTPIGLTLRIQYNNTFRLLRLPRFGSAIRDVHWCPHRRFLRRRNESSKSFLDMIKTWDLTYLGLTFIVTILDGNNGIKLIHLVFV